MNSVYIVYNNYYDINTNRISVGGIQTYISNLLPIIKKYTSKIYLYQISTKNFVKMIDGIEIYGITCKSSNIYKQADELYQYYGPMITSDDLVIFGTDTLIKKVRTSKIIGIQHGIAWDKPISFKSDFGAKTYYVGRSIRSMQMIDRIELVKKLVCVDYNYINWYRALTGKTGINLVAIPNFANVPETCPIKPDGVVKLIFARRFFTYRGTRIFTTAILNILKDYPNLDVTIAGEGPDEAFIKNSFENIQNVNITRYDSKDSMKMHADKAIAVIPTLGSEGTSLSLLEAMASGCAVVCTNVGGMTNIVIDSYNGLMVNPTSNELEQAIRRLLINKDFASSLGTKAYETVKNGFSLKVWNDRWNDLLSTF